MTTTVGTTDQVYELFIKASPERVWDAIINPEFTVHFWTDFHALFGSHVDDPHVDRASSIWLRRT